ncbi:MAG: DUF1638 domain-containing protein [Deltaproteobacteria bacterium]|nr:DUF1638 domain-containing protein [Deltaproteobacteria bacterium]
MPVLGVLTCEILELEIAYLLKNDKSISKISIINSKACQGLIKALEKDGSRHFSVLESFDEVNPSKDEKLDVLIHVLEIGMHSRKPRLQRALFTESRKIGALADTLFLGYGLCGNALKDPDTLFSHLDIPFFLPRDKGHPVDDCVGLFIGGRDSYYAEQIKEAGTFFMTPGWTTHWKAIFEKDFGNISLKTAKRLFKHYKRTLLVSTPVMEDSQMEKNIREFNDLFHCYSEISQGSIKMLAHAWHAAIKRIQTDLVRQATSLKVTGV